MSARTAAATPGYWTLTATSRPSSQPRPVYLADRGRRDRLLVELLEHLLERVVELRLDHLAHVLEGDRRRGVSQLRELLLELLPVLLRNEPDVEERHHLADLHRGALHRSQRGHDLLGGLDVAALERLLAVLIAGDVGGARAELARGLVGSEPPDLGGAAYARGRDLLLGHVRQMLRSGPSRRSPTAAKGSVLVTAPSVPRDRSRDPLSRAVAERLAEAAWPGVRRPEHGVAPPGGVVPSIVPGACSTSPTVTATRTAPRESPPRGEPADAARRGRRSSRGARLTTCPAIPSTARNARRRALRRRWRPLNRIVGRWPSRRRCCHDCARARGGSCSSRRSAAAIPRHRGPAPPTRRSSLLRGRGRAPENCGRGR